MRSGDVEALLANSKERLKHGNVKGALGSLEEALNLAPEDAWAWAHHGDILYQHLGRYEQAVASFNRAIAIQPNYAWALAHRGAALERLDRFQDAERDLESALRLQPEYAWALALLGRVYQMTERFDRGLAAVEAVIERDPWVLPYWREERAMMRMLLRRHEEADHFFRIALEADPDDRFAHYNGTVNLVLWRGLEHAAGAIARLRTRLESAVHESRDGRTVDRSIFELGGLSALEGKHEDALARLREAIDRERHQVLLSPATKRARVDLAWLELRSNPSFVSLTRSQHMQPSKNGEHHVD